MAQIFEALCIVEVHYKALQRIFHTAAFVSKQKETNNKGNGPICRKDVWSPLLNAFNQVRPPCSTFYASIDSGHAFMRHTIITESRNLEIGTVHSSTRNGFQLINSKCENYTPQNVTVEYDFGGFIFFLSQSLVRHSWQGEDGCY